MPNVNQIVNHIIMSIDPLNLKEIGQHVARSDLNIEKNSNFIIQARSISIISKEENNVSKWSQSTQSSILIFLHIYQRIVGKLLGSLFAIQTLIYPMYDTLGDISSVNTIDIIIYYENITSTIIIPLISKPPSIPQILLTGRHDIG